MSPEGHKPSETNYSTLITIGAIGLLSLFAFSKKTRQVIYERDVTCRICGSVNHLEAAHVDHDKDNPLYDDPSNGRLLCGADHALDHINRAGRNGLTDRANNWAISMILRRLR